MAVKSLDVTEQRDRLGEFARFIITSLLDDGEIEFEAVQEKAIALNLIIKDKVTKDNVDKYYWLEIGDSVDKIQPWLEELTSVTGID